MRERHQLSTRPAGEMEEVDTAIHLAVHSPYCGSHGVDPILTVGVRVDDRPRELDQLQVSVGKLFSGDSHPQDISQSGEVDTVRG